MILQIDDTADRFFPDPHYGDEDGCFAIGGDLSIDRLLLAYSNGIFPWYSFRDQPEILWFCPMKRFVIFPDEIHQSFHAYPDEKEPIQRRNQRRFRWRDTGMQQDQRTVLGRWRMAGREHHQAFTALHKQGFAASVEVWDNETDELVGGLYELSPSARFL